MSNLQQMPYDDDITIGLSYNEPHLACVLLLDTSGSMFGEPIDSLNYAIEQFKQQTMTDELARRRVDVAVIAFDSEVRLIQDFVPIQNMAPIRLDAHGSTKMAQGIQFAIDKVKERNRLYDAMGTPCFKPWIFMITDGCPDKSEDIYSAVMRVAEEEERGKLKFFALGVRNYNKDILFSITNRVIELRDANFTNIFNWLSRSMIAISVSRIGENVSLDMLPEDARKARLDRDVSDW